MEFKIQEDSRIFKQVYDQIVNKILIGEIKKGSRLPTERELSLQLNIARGTVKKAYEELEKNEFIEKIHGSGCYVRTIPQSFEEIRIPNDMNIKNRLSPTVRIAFVDCNLESLALFKQQLSFIENKTLSVFLLDAIKMDDDPQKLLDEYDLVLTTFSHFNDLKGFLPNYNSKLIKIAVAPCQRTIVDIATIPSSASIGIICRNNRFLTIMKANLTELLITKNKIVSLFEEDYVTMLESIHEVDVVIAAPDSIIFDSKIVENPHKRIIKFNYQIERGSIVYIEALVKQILSSMQENAVAELA